MGKIRVIKKSNCAEIGGAFVTEENSTRTEKRELAETVHDWVMEWRERREIETRRALEECKRLRFGSPVGI